MFGLRNTIRAEGNSATNNVKLVMLTHQDDKI